MSIEYLIDMGLLREREEGKFLGTPQGERFVRKFSKKLRKHEYKGYFIDEIAREKERRERPSDLHGTVHSAIGAPALGVPGGDSTSFWEYPRKIQENGVECVAGVLGYNHGLKKGDTVYLEFHGDPLLFETRHASATILNIEEQEKDKVEDVGITKLNLGMVRCYSNSMVRLG